MRFCCLKSKHAPLVLELNKIKLNMIRVWNTVLGYNLKKWQNDLGSFSRQVIQHHSNPTLCPYQWCQEVEADQYYEDLEDILKVAPKKMFYLSLGFGMQK